MESCLLPLIWNFEDLCVLPKSLKFFAFFLVNSSQFFWLIPLILHLKKNRSTESINILGIKKSTSAEKESIDVS